MLNLQSRAPAAAPQRPEFKAHLARGPEDVRAAQRLRYEVFVAEMGAGGALVDHERRCEMDSFDAHAEHLILRDLSRPEPSQVIGTYRLLTEEGAARAGGFYSEAEFDLSPLFTSGRRLLELGRSCLHPDYRGGAAMLHMWQALSDVVRERGIELLFGVASFPTTRPASLAEPLSHLHNRHLAPPALRVTSRVPADVPDVPHDQINRVRAMRATPALIKAYLRLGGCIGQGAFVDHTFNTTDICMILEAAALRDTTALALDAKGRG